MSITAPLFFECEARVPPQNLGTVSTNNIAGDDILASFNASNVTYDELGVWCPGGIHQTTGTFQLNGNDTGSELFYT